MIDFYTGFYVNVNCYKSRHSIRIRHNLVQESSYLDKRFLLSGLNSDNTYANVEARFEMHRRIRTFADQRTVISLSAYKRL